jgi:hypothetical protein
MKIIIFLLIILFIVHIYLHFMVHPENYLAKLSSVTQEEITNTVYYKLPFIIDGSSIIQPICYKDYSKLDKNTYSKTYESIPLLEPLVKFFTKDTIYKLKGVLPVHFNLECRNYYIVHSGSVNITVVHPKYKDLSNIEEHSKMIHVELKKGDILFVPNYWNVHIKANKKCVIEKLQYSTIMNQFNFLWNNINTFL